MHPDATKHLQDQAEWSTMGISSSFFLDSETHETRLGEAGIGRADGLIPGRLTPPSIAMTAPLRKQGIDIMVTWSTADTKHSGCISRRLSHNSFLTDDPQRCTEWLKALEYKVVPRHGPREYARLELGTGTAIVYSSGLVVTTLGVQP